MSYFLCLNISVGWNCFQMGLGRKIDPEPGRCRRTDGKKWRCSKEAFADSKYCEKHMHRGKNRSRKPVEIMSTPSPTTATTSYANSNNSSKPLNHNLSSSSSSVSSKSQSLGTPSNFSTPPYSLSSFNSDTQHHHHPFYNTHSTHLHHYLQSPSSKPRHGSALSHQENNTTPYLLLDSGSYSQTDPDYRFVWKSLQLSGTFLTFRCSLFILTGWPWLWAFNGGEGTGIFMDLKQGWMSMHSFQKLQEQWEASLVHPWKSPGNLHL